MASAKLRYAMSDKPLALTTMPPAEPEPPAGVVDYDAICSTVMATTRGRWFLEEYARRNRNADTRLLLDAIERIEGVVRGERSRQADLMLRTDLLEMARAIAQTRAQVTEIKVTEIKPDAAGGGKQPEPDAEPPRDIFAAAERLQEVAWTMRERGLDFATCAQIEELATTILSASVLRDPADRRAQKIGEVLQYLEVRIEAMLAGCAAPAGAASELTPAAAPGTDAAEAPPPVDVARESQAELAAAPPGDVVEIEPEPPAADAILAVDADAAKLPAAVASAAAPAEPEPPAALAGPEPADFLLEPLPDLDMASGPPPLAAPLPPSHEPPPDLPLEADDELFAGTPALAPALAEQPHSPAPPIPRAAGDSLAALMAMSDEERIAVFT